MMQRSKMFDMMWYDYQDGAVYSNSDVNYTTNLIIEDFIFDKNNFVSLEVINWLSNERCFVLWHFDAKWIILSVAEEIRNSMFFIQQPVIITSTLI